MQQAYQLTSDRRYMSGGNDRRALPECLRPYHDGRVELTIREWGEWGEWEPTQFAEYAEEVG